MALGLVIVDTDVIIDFLRGRGAGAQLVAQLITERRLRTTAVTAFELRLGTDFLKRRDDITRLLRSRTFTFDMTSALHAGAVYSDLRRTGELIGYRDTMIAGTCLRYGLPLATRNIARFARVNGLALEPVSAS